MRHQPASAQLRRIRWGRSFGQGGLRDQVSCGEGNISLSNAHLIVFANEKGGSGKSTTSVHVAVALATAGKRVAAIDLDTRQRTLSRYFENRVATVQRSGVALATPTFETFDSARGHDLGAMIDAFAADHDVVVIDTPRPRRRICPRRDRARRHAGHPDQRQLRRSRPDRPGRSRDLQDPPPQLLRRTGVGRAQGTRPRRWRHRRLGAAAQPPPASRGAQHAPRRRRDAGPVEAGRLPGYPGPVRTRHLPRTLPQGPHPARSQGRSAARPASPMSPRARNCARWYRASPCRNGPSTRRRKRPWPGDLGPAGGRRGRLVDVGARPVASAARRDRLRAARRLPPAQGAAGNLPCRCCCPPSGCSSSRAPPRRPPAAPPPG